ncbi:MAG: nucleotidyl transferase AbiEii/AbiGii toxin family protein [archaeon]
MIEKKLISYIADKANVKNPVLLEKDILLHQILVLLSKNDFFNQSFAFKGGTCLVKCYLGYYRFSEDLDFTYINQAGFIKKSEKQIRKMLSVQIDQIIDIIIDIANLLGLEFKKDKADKKYIELGGSNKFVTFKLGYKSVITNADGFIKIQINFDELLLYKFNNVIANSLIGPINEKELKFLFPKESSYLLENPEVIAYDLREILVEKARAILTRKSIKTRDFIDIYLITQKINKKIELFEDEIIKKTIFMLKYEKYKQNLKEKIETGKWYKSDDESYLLLKPINAFSEYSVKLSAYLSEIAGKKISN